jgi:hypothetical protein
MAQAVSRRPLTTVTWLRVLVNLCKILGGQGGTGTGIFFVFFGSFPANIIPPWLSILIYLGNE